ncbi:MAG: ABC transporter ATP-binding protein [Halofilum sp. (in: g-proteobacteria)]|nr:ABC transporter ATP-binding protein [Halofilum sp. (in: g-proteobacteria)]
MLRVAGLEAGYGPSRVLFGVDLEVDAGEVVTLLGRNGMGKTTTMRAITGLNPPTAGRIEVDGRDVAGAPPHRIARLGIGLVPEGRRIFPTLSARENLVATATNRSGTDRPWDLQAVFELLPALADCAARPGRQLSGGEQQMLAIGRALMTNPRLLILDEAAEGLAPKVRAEIWRVLGRLQQTGQSILVIDQNLDALMRLADRHYIMEKGRIVWSGDSQALSADADLRHRTLGVA